MKVVYVIGTCDTKSADLLFVADSIKETGVGATIVDVSTKRHHTVVDVSNTTVTQYHPSEPGFMPDTLERGKAGVMMSEALGTYLLTREDLGGVIGIGGSGNTAIITAAMRKLPVGLPKLMVSTMASGDVGGYVGPTDITMMYSVTDIAGLNPLSRVILGNAAHAIAGMVKHAVEKAQQDKPLLGMTMYGVTTPAVMEVKSQLEDRFDVLVFHATGRGGQSLEKLIESKIITHVIDLTTTEIVDHLFDGLMTAGEDRLGAMIRTRIPYVASVGAFDMITFGAKETVPEQYRNRLSQMHNANITLVRTTIEENRIAGKWLAERLNMMEGPVRLLIPEGGLSQLDAPGMPFHDPQANGALFDAIEETIVQTEDRQVLRVPCHINDPRFADQVVASFKSLWGLGN